MAEVSRSTRLPQARSVPAGLWAANKYEKATRSEDCLRATVDWHWEADRDLNYVYISKGIVRVFGRPAELLLGRPVVAMGRPAASDAAWLGLLALLKKRVAFRDRILEIADSRDLPRRVSLSGVPVFDPATGAFSGYRGTGREIKETESGGTALEDLRQSLSDVSQLTALWYWSSDDRLRLKSLCDSYPRVTGLSRPDGLGQDLAEVWKLGRSVRAALLGREEFRDAPADWAHQELEGRRRYLISGRPVFEADGRFAGYRGIGRDVTELLRSEENAHLARVTAEQASRAKSDFLADMSHELRTSLNAIIGFSDAMRSGLLGADDSDHYQGYAKDIHDSGQHLLALVNDMLDLSRIEAGQESLSCEPVDVAKLIESCCRMLGPEVGKRGLILKASVGENPPRVQVDPPKMRQILLNLLGNAVKFTPAGGQVSVAFRVAGDGAAELEVRDSGVGIKESEIPKILTRFGQAGQPDSEPQAGAGLGLAITKSLIELHGGTLVVESAEGLGARFLIRLPAERVIRESGDDAGPPWRLLY